MVEFNKKRWDEIGEEPVSLEQMKRAREEFGAFDAKVPSHWRKELNWGPAGAKYRHKWKPDQTVLISVMPQEDGRFWLHASIANDNDMPTYRDLLELKKSFIGKDRKAVMVFPADSEYVNIHEFALHLFCSLDDDPLPDFTRGTGSI